MGNSSDKALDEKQDSIFLERRTDPHYGGEIQIYLTLKHPDHKFVLVKKILSTQDNVESAMNIYVVRQEMKHDGLLEIYKIWKTGTDGFCTTYKCINMMVEYLEMSMEMDAKDRRSFRTTYSEAEVWYIISESCSVMLYLQ